MKRLKRATYALLALIILCTTVLAQPTLAVTQADINGLKGDAADLTAQKKALEKKLNALSNDKAQVMDRKRLLDDQITIQAKEISNVESQIATYQGLIEQTQAELQDAEEKETTQTDLFHQRVRAMEERGTVSYWSVLFNANDFSDLLGRLDAVNEIMDADQAIIDGLQKLQAEITAKEEELEQSKADSEAAKVELQTKKRALEAQRTTANQLMLEIEENKGEYEATLDEIEAEEEAIQRRIVEMSKKLAAEQAAAGKYNDVGPGGYIWPVSSRYITSTVGGRKSPGGIGSTNHKGTDIGRVGYTTEVHASKAGTVLVSQYSSSYGNYVVISHGSGNTTLYGHMSSLKATVGQVVAQGDVVGITGNTGHSTGPHLHFEVTENGVRVNPLSDGAEPQRGYLTGYTLSKK